LQEQKEGLSKDKINEVERKSKAKNIKDINEFKNGFEERTDLVKDRNGNLAYSPIFRRWTSYFSQLLNVHGFMMLGK
jgi:hypothetical protein